MRYTAKISLLTLGFLLLHLQSFAQCAMCRATIETNVSNGDTSIGAGLNLGIMYLLVMPYLIAAVIGFFWYRNSKKRKAKFTFQGEKF
ncbi:MULTISPECIES: hypothetical protein [Rhodonellum]|nr:MULTISPECIES: hypothetical protein [Rhodonellum]SDY98498.1 hypothetical protein SAMN05444412_104182 [Rhodonellum ikkaensis]